MFTVAILAQVILLTKDTIQIIKAAMPISEDAANSARTYLDLTKKEEDAKEVPATNPFKRSVKKTYLDLAEEAAVKEAATKEEAAAFTALSSASSLAALAALVAKNYLAMANEYTTVKAAKAAKAVTGVRHF